MGVRLATLRNFFPGNYSLAIVGLQLMVFIDRGPVDQQSKQ
jgi:hypothetical protein